MNERTRILDLLSAGKITVDEAERLLEAIRDEQREAAAQTPPESGRRVQRAVAILGSGDDGPAAGKGGKPRFLRIHVVENGGDKVNIRIPLGLLKAGLKLKGLMPESARAKMDVALQEKGVHFNLSDLEGKSLDEIVEVLHEMSIDVDGDKETVRIFCE